MDIKQFSKDDIEQIDSWYRARNLSPVPFDQLPQFGYIIPNIACGFLVQTDSANAFLEGFVTNPEASNKAQAIDIIAKKLISVAKELGYKHVFAMTIHPTVIAACKDNEFVSLGQYNTFYKEVK